MHPVEAQFTEIVQRFAVLAQQMGAAFQAEQTRSGLDQVLDPVRLQSSEGTELSLLTLNRLRAQAGVHRDAFHRFTLTFSSQLGAVLAELPSAAQADCRSRWSAAVDGSLQAQTRLYEQREHWIEVAADVCRLIESRREAVTFSAQGIHFTSDEDAMRLAQLLGRLRAIRESEAQQWAQQAEQGAAAAVAAPPAG